MAIDRSAGIDAAIDDAARAMTATPPPEALRRAVLERVETPAGRGSWAWPRLGAAIAAVVLVMAVVQWMSHPAPVMPVTGGPAVAPANAASRDPVAPAGASPPGVSPTVTPATVARRGPVVLRRTASGVVPPSTIDVTPVAIVPLGTEAAVVVEPVPVPAAIDITPIAVSPLSIGVARDALEE